MVARLTLARSTSTQPEAPLAGVEFNHQSTNMNAEKKPVQLVIHHVLRPMFYSPEFPFFSLSLPPSQDLFSFYSLLYFLSFLSFLPVRTDALQHDPDQQTTSSAIPDGKN